MMLLFRRLLALLPKRVQRVGWFVLLAAILVSFFSALRPYLIQGAMDTYVLTSQLDGFARYMLLIGLVLLMEAVFQYAYIYLSNWMGQEVVLQLRKKIFLKITTFRLRYFDLHKTGAVVTRVVSDIQSVADIFSQGLVTIVGDGLKVLVFLGIMFFMDARLTMIVMIAFPILLLVTRWFQRSIKKSFQAVRTQISRLNAFVIERIQGMGLIQSFHREMAEMQKFEKINKKHMRENIRTIWFFSLYFPVVDFLSSITVAAIVWYGGFRSVFHQDVSIGTLVAFIYLIQALFRPLRQIADKFNTLQMGFVACHRVFNLLDEPGVEVDRGKVKKKLMGGVVFENVAFSYDTSRQVLHDVNFEVNPSQFAAFVGSSGSGKSTIMGLINRLYDIDSGAIRFDDTRIEDIPISHLRENIGVVLQDPFLFSTSIYENVVMYRNIPLQEVRAGAKSLGIETFIEDLPGGFQFEVGERGGKLSVGQRQLIALLRVFLGNPPIIILDEATASVDSNTEALIQSALTTLSSQRTLLVVAHRLATIRQADNIFVIDKGRLVERGNHESLMSKQGLYKTLYEAQLRAEK